MAAETLVDGTTMDIGALAEVPAEVVVVLAAIVADAAGTVISYQA